MHTFKLIFFLRGDVRKLAACGTINDLPAMGARPLAMASAVLIEKGFPISTLKKILLSMNEVIQEFDVAPIAGDEGHREGGVDEIILSTCLAGSMNCLKGFWISLCT